MADIAGVPTPVGDLTNEQLMDLWAITTRSRKDVGIEWALDHEAYLFVDGILREDRTEEAGTAIQGRINVDSAGNARFVDPWEEVQPEAPNTLVPYAIPWRYIQGNFSTERHELLENAGSAEKLADYADLKRGQGLIDVANLVEESFFADAAGSESAKALWGVKTWAGKYEDTVDGAGYYGGMPSGWSSLAGIVPATSGAGASTVTGGKAKWRNFCAGYKTVNAHLIDQMMLTYARMKFRAPLIAQDIVKQPYENFKIITGVKSWVNIGALQRKKGDDNGAELARVGATLTFMGTPIEHTDILDDDTDDPIYLINRSKFKAVVLAGDNFRIGAAMNDRKQPNVFTTFIDLTLNVKCLNRRQGIAVVNKY